MQLRKSICAVDEQLHHLEIEIKKGQSELEYLRSALTSSESRREAAERRVLSLQDEVERLRLLRQGELETIQRQFQYRKMYEEAEERLKTQQNDYELRMDELKGSLSHVDDRAAQDKNMAEDRIRNLEREISEAWAMVVTLEERLEKQAGESEREKKQLKESAFSLKVHYESELANIRNRLHDEETRRNSLEKSLSMAEYKSSLAESQLQEQMKEYRQKMEELSREAMPNRHADAIKQRMMKMRKENDELRRQLQAYQGRR